MLKLLGHEIAKQAWTAHSKQIFWTAACLAFFGSCRMGELLADELKYDPFNTLLWKDVKLKNQAWLLHIKAPKSGNLGGEYADIFPFKNHGCCPVKALIKLKALSKNQCNDMPVFTLENGKPLTVSHFGSIVNKLLEKRIGKSGGYVTGHSFRAGIPSTLAMHPDLISNYHIMGWGRWSSSAYLCYTKLKLCQKKRIFEKIVNVLNQ